MRTDAFYQNIRCPHCGNDTSVAVDASGGEQDYYEDCQACCNAIHLHLAIDEQKQQLKLYVDSDDEQFY